VKKVKCKNCIFAKGDDKEIVICWADKNPIVNPWGGKEAERYCLFFEKQYPVAKINMKQYLEIIVK